MKHILFVAALLLSVNSAYAHEGHDHDAPGAVEAPKGGTIKSTESFHVEVVAKGSDLKIYLYSSDLKPADASGFNVKLSATLPRAKKAESLTFKAAGNVLEANFDAKGAHRYTLIVNIGRTGAHGHDDKLSFTIEPRK